MDPAYNKIHNKNKVKAGLAQFSLAPQQIKINKKNKNNL